MRNSYDELPNGYLETIEKGIAAVRTFRGGLSAGSGDRYENIRRLMEELRTAEAVVIGAGAGLSTAAGYTYAGERFDRYFFDFAAKYGFRDMYAGGFTDFDSPEEMWAFFSRNIYVNRYMPTPKPLYERLLELVRGRDYYVVTTNVDHCFQRAGFDKERLFYTQGDYGLWQCSLPCRAVTYDNEAPVRNMLAAQGFTFGRNGELIVPEEGPASAVPSELIPRCPICGRPMTMNLRVDERFVEDAGWQTASKRYADFLEQHRDRRVLFLEAAVGYNTPGIIKYPFRRMTRQWPQAVYACLNRGEAEAPPEIADRSICIDGDVGELLEQLTAER
jgi:NAD-dependent SIR2 family protein deacetylase